MSAGEMQSMSERNPCVVDGLGAGGGTRGLGVTGAGLTVAVPGSEVAG